MTTDSHGHELRDGDLVTITCQTTTIIGRPDMVSLQVVAPPEAVAAVDYLPFMSCPAVLTTRTACGTDRSVLTSHG